jgi:hypothetical protein
LSILLVEYKNIMFNWINVLELFPRERKIEKQILPKIPYEECRFVLFRFWWRAAGIVKIIGWLELLVL